MPETYSSVLRDAEENCRRLLNSKMPKIGNIVDRSDSLRQVYERIKKVSDYSWTGSRKPVIGLSNSAGPGKSLLMALAVNKIAPVVSGETGKPSEDVLDLEKRLDLDYLPIYLSFSDSSRLNFESDKDLDQIIANKILYWLCSKYGEVHICNFLPNDGFLTEHVMEHVVGLKVPIVLFIDEIRQLESFGILPAACLGHLIRPHSYDDPKVAIVASSTLSKDFTKLYPLRSRGTRYIEMEMVTSVNSFISPLLKHNAQLTEFFADEKNYRMMKSVLLKCLGNPKLMNYAMDYFEDFGNLSRLDIYGKLMDRLQLELTKDCIPLKVVASAFCQWYYKGMERDVEKLLEKNSGISIIDTVHPFPFIPPILMEVICRETNQL